jgi:hypothetical protein
MGSDKFVEVLLASDDRMIRERKVIKRKKIRLETCLALVSKELGLTEEELIGRGRNRMVTRGTLPPLAPFGNFLLEFFKVTV